MAQRYVIGETGARKLTALFNSAAAGPSAARQNGLAIENDYAHPFYVTWAQSAAEGEGSWIIYIPSDSCCIMDGTKVDLTSSLDPVEDDYPDGWYLLEDIEEDAEAVYLNVSGGTGTFSGTESGDSSILIATLDDKEVIQNVRSAIIGSGSSDRSCFRFGTVEVEEEGETVLHPAIVCCYYNVGGTTKHMNDVDISEILPDPPGEGEDPVVTYLCLKIVGSTPYIVAIEEDDLQGEQKVAANFVRPLYRYVGADMTDDLRNAQNIQMFEGDLS